MEQVDQLLALFDERDRLRNVYNDELAAMLAPTAMTAMFELFELGPEAVQWGAIDLVDETIIFILSLTYNSSDDISEFLQYMDIAANASPTARVRTLRVGVPVNLAFGEIDKIKEYLMNTVKVVAASKAPTKPVAKRVIEKNADEFDVQELTREQLAQLLWHQNNGSGETQ